MPGVRGRSGGSNRIPVQVHLAKGTFRPARHAARLAALSAQTGVLAKYRPAPVVPPLRAVDRPPLPASVLAGLGARGQAFARDCWDAYADWSPASLALLHEAGHLLDALEALRGQKGERAAQREFRAMVTALKLED
jgi:hypothetical protein